MKNLVIFLGLYTPLTGGVMGGYILRAALDLHFEKNLVYLYLFIIISMRIYIFGVLGFTIYFVLWKSFSETHWIGVKMSMINKVFPFCIREFSYWNEYQIKINNNSPPLRVSPFRYRPCIANRQVWMSTTGKWLNTTGIWSNTTGIW